MARQRVIVTGAAGYLGRCTAEILRQKGLEPVVLDRRPLPADDQGVQAVQVDLTDRQKTFEAIQSFAPIHGVIHFAAYALVSESWAKPEMYFYNNVLSTVYMAEAALAAGANKFVFSSSCAVYGIPNEVPIPEEHSFAPVSPYGESKRMCEGVLKQYCDCKKLKVMALRYFNPAGSVPSAEPGGKRLGELHNPETHLVPNVVRNIMEDKPVSIFGNDYETEDGTCVRDFIHVHDLVDVHLLALAHLSNQKEGFFQALNIGTGTGSSVKEVITAAEEVLGKSAQIEQCPRRPGDPPKLIANPQKVHATLNWKATKSIKEMIQDHYDLTHSSFY